MEGRCRIDAQRARQSLEFGPQRAAAHDLEMGGGHVFPHERQRSEQHVVPLVALGEAGDDDDRAVSERVAVGGQSTPGWTTWMRSGRPP